MSVIPPMEDVQCALNSPLATLAALHSEGEKGATLITLDELTEQPRTLTVQHLQLLQECALVSESGGLWRVS